MTGKQSGVMWLGLLLIVVRLFTTQQWSDLWATVGTKVPSQKLTLETQNVSNNNTSTAV